VTVIVSVKINDGIVMAADSVTTFGPFDLAGKRVHQAYAHANKIVNLRKDLPIGAMTAGGGGIGRESIDTLLKDLRRRFSGKDREHLDWALEPTTYTMEQVTAKVREFLMEKAEAHGNAGFTMVRLCGYSANESLPEVWHVNIATGDTTTPFCAQGKEEFGIQFNGELEPLTRLIKGVSYDFSGAAARVLVKAQDPQPEAEKLEAAIETARAEIEKHVPGLVGELHANLVMPAMPIQDAIDLARFLVDTSAGFMKFSITDAKTVGGPIEIAAITKHEGFKWVQRKHFYKSEINPPA